MIVVPIGKEVVVFVGVRDRVGVEHPAVEVREGVLVLMGVVTHERIDDDERRAGKHHGECQEICPGKASLQKDEGQERPHEWRHGVVCVDEQGKVDPARLDAIAFDQFRHGYYVTGEKAGQAWNAGSALAKAALGR